jgi:hypothetical protein
MLACGMTTRWLPALACVGLIGCTVYDDGLLTPRGGTSGQHSGGRSGGDGGDVDSCAPSAEVCNDVDDDCNGIVDDEQPASADCSFRYHATVRCGDGFCLFMPSDPMCDPGYYNCDGLPQNGCELPMPCCAPMCRGDAGSDDAGDDDAG